MLQWGARTVLKDSTIQAILEGYGNTFTYLVKCSTQENPDGLLGAVAARETLASCVVLQGFPVFQQYNANLLIGTSTDLTEFGDDLAAAEKHVHSDPQSLESWPTALAERAAKMTKAAKFVD